MSLSSQTVSIGYLGNMGIIIGEADKSIIIDGLHESYKPHYAYPTAQMVNFRLTEKRWFIGQPTSTKITLV